MDSIHKKLRIRGLTIKVFIFYKSPIFCYRLSRDFSESRLSQDFSENRISFDLSEQRFFGDKNDFSFTDQSSRDFEVHIALSLLFAFIL